MKGDLFDSLIKGKKTRFKMYNFRISFEYMQMVYKLIIASVQTF
jgi:hypothetical protein